MFSEGGRRKANLRSRRSLKGLEVKEVDGESLKKRRVGTDDSMEKWKTQSNMDDSLSGPEDLQLSGKLVYDDGIELKIGTK